MENIERRVRREVRAMTRREVITKAIVAQLSWAQAAEVLAITPRHMRRVRRAVERQHFARDVRPLGPLSTRARGAFRSRQPKRSR